MKTIGNLIWFLFVGLESFIAWFTLGIFWCITVVGIPFGKQCFKLASLSAWPFGRDAETDFGSHPVANVIWMIFGGIGLAITYFFTGIFWCITILGIPFGKQCFKLARLSLTPFGARIS